MSGSIAHGWQPIGAQHVKVRLEAGEQKKVIFILGYHENAQDQKFSAPAVINKAGVLPLIQRFLQPAEVQAAFSEYRFNDAVRGVVDYSNYSYKTMGEAGYYGGGLFATISRTSAGATFHRMEGAVERLRYREIRLYAAKDMEGWRVSFDVINHHYDQPFNGLRDSYSLNGTVRYAISDSLTSNLSVEYSKTPDFLRNTMVLLNLVYNFASGR